MADEYVSLLALSVVPKAMTISDIQNATDTDKTMHSLMQQSIIRSGTAIL